MIILNSEIISEKSSCGFYNLTLCPNLIVFLEKEKTLSLQNTFNDTYRAIKENDYVLTVRYGTQAGTVYLSYDFMGRFLLSRNGTSEGGINLTPFSQIDREVLEVHRQQLVSLGGRPPELPPRADDFGLRPFRKGFNP